MIYYYKSGRFSTKFRLFKVSELLAKYINSRNEKYIFFIDKNVSAIYNGLTDIIKKKWQILYVNPSEPAKSFKQIINLYNTLHKLKINRSYTFVALGGGVTTDLVGFLASTYMRGCRLNLVPTTLLAMTDAAVGGKTGLNFMGSKNLAGTFYPADEVNIDLDFLKTLKKNDLQNGWAEIVKVSLLKSPELYSFLAEKKRKVSKKLIKLAIEAKMRYCIDDIDTEKRIFLNLGHTFAHVLESSSSFSINHGKAVAIGMRAAAVLSQRLDFLTPGEYSKIIEHMNKYELPDGIENESIDFAKISDFLIMDKKNTSSFNIILFKGKNELTLEKIKDSNIIESTIKTILKNS